MTRNAFTACVATALVLAAPGLAAKNSRGAENGQPFQQLQSAIDQAEAAAAGAIAAEAAARQAGDQAAQDAIAVEQAAREAGDAALRSEVAAEEAARIAADLQLQAGIDANALAIAANASDISGFQAQIDAINVDLDALETEVSLQGLDIAATVDEVDALAGQVGVLGAGVAQNASALFDLSIRHDEDIAALEARIDAIELEVGTLAAELDLLRGQLEIDLQSLQAAIDANSDELLSLAAALTLTNGQLSLVQSSILSLELRTSSLEDRVDLLEDESAGLGAALLALQARVALLEQGEVFEFTFVDTPGDDVDGSGFRAFMQGIVASSNDFIYVEGIAANSGAWCSTNAAWYVDAYLQTFNTSVSSGTWDKWSRGAGTNWTADNQAYLNYYGSACGGEADSWCSEWGIGGNTIGFLPNFDLRSSSTNGSEVFNAGFSNGNGSFTVRIASTRAEACGF